MDVATEVAMTPEVSRHGAGVGEAPAGQQLAVPTTRRVIDDGIARLEDPPARLAET
jgi:hypothetical protein